MGNCFPYCHDFKCPSKSLCRRFLERMASGTKYKGRFFGSVYETFYRFMPEYIITGILNNTFEVKTFRPCFRVSWTPSIPPRHRNTKEKRMCRLHR